MKFPIYMTIGEVAKVLGWGHMKTKRWLAAANVLVPRGERLVVTCDRLRDAFPEVWDEYICRLEEREANGE